MARIQLAGPEGSYRERIERLRDALSRAETVVIGAGAGLSTSAGFVYDGERFRKYFSDFEEVYGFHDMYSGGFQPYRTKEESWAFFSRMIWVNRYMDPPTPLYQELRELVEGKDYFVITTNVDHCFQKAGFDKERLFYTQGDYGLFQCSVPCHDRTYANEETIRQMLHYQGFRIGEDKDLTVPEGTVPKMTVPRELFPVCPVCGREMTINLRGDDRFVEDAGWHEAAERYERFLDERGGKTLFLELGVGYNTPVIIKYPFWNMTMHEPEAVYACLNYNEAYAPVEMIERSILIDGDIREALTQLKSI